MTGFSETTKFPFPVLIVEDNLLMRKILETSVGAAGYDVISAGNGREAFELFEKGYYPIVITDWVMPEMDGLQLCRAIRNCNGERYTYTILLTSLDSQEDLVAGLEAGADEYLIKPLKQAELAVRLKTARRIINLEFSLKESLEEIKSLSMKDPLTGTNNRRYLEERLPQEIKRADRYERPISLIMVDVDHFKKVNDNYGHRAGDMVLQECVKCMVASVRREIDWLARYGGEEFVVVLPETDLTGALIVAERLRQSLAGKVISHDRHEISVTASFGVASCIPAQEKMTVDTFLEYADHCLYQAKNEGRNRVKGIQL